MDPVIHDLSVELIEQIYRHLDPSSHFDFAIVSKHIYAYSFNILEKHRKYHQSYRSINQPLPGKYLSVLYNVAKDHVAAWHVRSINGFNYVNNRSPKYNWCNERVVDLANMVRSIMRANNIPVFSLRRLRDGYFGAAEPVVFALCSRLHTIKFCRLFPPPLQGRIDSDSEEDEDEDSDAARNSVVKENPEIEELHDIWSEAVDPS